MRRLWLIFAQTCTVCLAVLFVVSTLKPDWVSRVGRATSVVLVQEQPAPEPSAPAPAPPKSAVQEQPAELPPTPAPAPDRGRAGGLGFISPVVSRIAGENHVDLSRVKGTGEGGRITKKDVLAYLETRQEAPSPTPAAAPARQKRA